MSSTAAVVPGVAYHFPKPAEGHFSQVGCSDRDTVRRRYFSEEAGSTSAPVDGCTTSLPSHSVPASFDAALKGSLRPYLRDKTPCFPSHQDHCPKFVHRTLSFQESVAPPLDAVIRQRIQSLPRHLILSDCDSQSTCKQTKHALLLCDNLELERLCRIGSQYVPRHPLGLGNAGNTCYLNSVLQCLLATGPLLAYVSTTHSNPSACTVAAGQAGNLQSGLNKSRFCGLCGLVRLLKEHSQRSQLGGAPAFGCSLGGQIVPSYFVSNVRSVCPNFHPYQQEDAHEFLLGLLSRMEDCAMAGMGKLSRNVAETNAIRRIFGGIIRSEVTCHSCRKVSALNEMCFNLSVDITCGRSLQQCLSNYIRSEELCGQNAYKCENCRQLRGAVRKSTIFQGPPILIIQFNRFSRNHKLDTRVEFPSSFNLRPFMTETKGLPVLYRLFATVNHEGYSCRSGHYVAFTRRNGTWFSHNDNFVNSTSVDHVLRQAPYLLFFEAANPVPGPTAAPPDTMNPSTARTTGDLRSLPANGSLSVSTAPCQEIPDHFSVSEIPLPPSTLPTGVEIVAKPSVAPFTVRKAPSLLPRAVNYPDVSRSPNASRSTSTEPQTLPASDKEPCAPPVSVVSATASAPQTGHDLVCNVTNATASLSAVHQSLYRDVYSSDPWEDRSSLSDCISKPEGSATSDPGPRFTPPSTEFRRGVPQKRRHSSSPFGERVEKRSASTSSIYYSPGNPDGEPGPDKFTSSSSVKPISTSSGDDSDSSIVWIPANHIDSSYIQDKHTNRRKRKRKMHSNFCFDPQLDQCTKGIIGHHHRCRHHRRRHKKRDHKRRHHFNRHRELDRRDIPRHDRPHHKFHRLHR